jgi:hypothetical protein
MFKDTMEEAMKGDNSSSKLEGAEIEEHGSEEVPPEFVMSRLASL